MTDANRGKGVTVLVIAVLVTGALFWDVIPGRMEFYCVDVG
jgi:hypothetical protein